MEPADDQVVTRWALAAGQPLGVGTQVGPEVPLLMHRSLYLPLQTAGQTIGVLQVGLRQDGTPYTAVDERTLAAFAVQVGLAISRAQLAEAATRAEVARRSDELKSTLLSSVSHDLRTPLASIKAAVTSLLAPDVAWERAARRELLTAIDEEADRLSRLVTNLLDVSRIEAGILRPAADWNSVEEVVAGVVDRLGPLLAGHPLKVSVPDGLPLARVDYVHIEQALTNLLENAAKYTPPTTLIEVTAGAGEGIVQVAVIDHGPGIPAGEREHVFDKFHRLAPARQSGAGTGLGLAIARGLIEANGGQVWAEETPGGGATLRLTVPAGTGLPAPPLPDGGRGEGTA
jgi:two-component system sensor histidine kinase KdpD